MKRIIKKMLDALGYEITKVSKPLSEDAHLPRGVYGSDVELSVFQLDDAAPVVKTGLLSENGNLWWQYPLHCLDKRLALVLLPGEGIKTSGTLRIGEDSRLFIRYASANADVKEWGLGCEVGFLPTSTGESVSLLRLPISAGRQGAGWFAVQHDLSGWVGYTGQFFVTCIHAGEDVGHDTLAIAELCIAREDELPLARARTFGALRTKNEINHFSAAYKHDMYSRIQDEQAKRAGGVKREIRSLGPTGCSDEEVGATLVVEAATPKNGESVYGYAARLLSNHIEQKQPDFAGRLKDKADKGGYIKVLSLCSGAARIEAGYAANVPENVEWSLLDINAELLGTAASQFPAKTKLDLIEANANDLSYSGEKWDVIICVSALHHLVELERVAKFIYQSLVDDGEFSHHIPALFLRHETQLLAVDPEVRFDIIHDRIRLGLFVELGGAPTL